MGLIIPGAGPAISGKVGGIVYSRNASGAYARTHVIPVNPSTPRQSGVRATFGTLANRWTTILTESQRQAWTDWGAATTFPARVVPSQHLKGLPAYTKANSIRVQAAQAIVDDGPVVNSLLNWTIPTFGDGANGDDVIVVTINPDDEWNATGGFISLYAAAPQNPAVNFFKGPYQYQSSILGSSGTLTTGTFSLAGAIATAVGNKIPVRMVASAPDGRPSQEFQGVLIIDA